jgi:hypothetical protein
MTNGCWLQWDDRKARGLFHHDITACETKVLYPSLINYPGNILIFFVAKFPTIMFAGATWRTQFCGNVDRRA